MSAPEFSRPVDVRQCDRRNLSLIATVDECAALAARLGLVRIDRLQADLQLARQGTTITAEGMLRAAFVQPCAVSAEDLDRIVEEPLSLCFVPASRQSDDMDIEIDSSDRDEIEYEGSTIDFGEAVAQSLALAIDPFAAGPDADEARARLRDAESSPFAVIAALRRGQDDGVGE